MGCHPLCRRKLGYSVPTTLEAAEPKRLIDMLDNIPAPLNLTAMEEKAPMQFKSYFEYCRVVSKKFRDFPDVCVIVVDLSRQCNGSKVWSTQILEDELPSFTTKNWYIVVFGNPTMPDVLAKVPTCGRWLTLAERASFAGFDHNLLSRFLSPRQISNALGNCVLVPVAQAVLGSVVGYLNHGLNEAIFGCPVGFGSMVYEQSNLDPVPSRKRLREKVAAQGLACIEG